MKLSELFVSHKQVDPVSFTKDTPALPGNIYLNLDRAQKAATPEKEDTSDWNTNKDSEVYNWSVGYSNPEVKEEPKKESILVPYRAEYTPDTYKKRNLIDYLKEKEKFISTVYKDSGGVETIGYGFTNPDIIKRGRLTELEASDLLVKDIEDRRNKLSSLITTWNKLNQNLLNALLSYGFNVGVENWKRRLPKLLAALNEGRFKEAAEYMDAVTDRTGKVLPGLVKRRLEEQEWFNS